MESVVRSGQVWEVELLVWIWEAEGKRKIKADSLSLGLRHRMVDPTTYRGRKELGEAHSG